MGDEMGIGQGEEADPAAHVTDQCAAGGSIASPAALWRSGES